MAYNNINKFILYQKVIDIVNAKYEEDVTTYSGIYKKYVNPIYPMCYNTFLKIINMPNIERKLEVEKQKAINQLKLF